MLVSERNYFTENNIDARVAHAPTQTDSMVLYGVYSNQKMNNSGQPALVCLEKNRILMYRLCDPQHAEIGDYVKIAGHFSQSIHKVRQSRCIHVDSCRVIKQTSLLLTDARQWHSKNQQQLIESLPQKIELKSLVQRDWHVFIHEQKKNVIVTLTATGVLHRVDFQFIYDFDSLRLKKVYLDYQFKGE